MGKELAVQGNNFIEKFQANDNIRTALTSYLGDERKVVRFVSSMKMCFATNPKLSKCSSDSLRNVFLNCAEWGLYPSHVTGECYVIPYKDEATFQLGYQGMIALAYRAGVKYIDAQVVYENDVFDYEYGANKTLKHVPDKFSDDRGDPKGAYAIATLESGITTFEILGKADIFKHRAKSQSWKSSQKYSPWNPDNDPQLIMWKKTALKQLFKMLPKTPEIRGAVNADIKGDIIDMDASQDDNVSMSQVEVVTFMSRLRESYSKTMVDMAIEEVLKRKVIEPLTYDEKAALEDWLLDQSTVPTEDEDQGKLI